MIGGRPYRVWSAVVKLNRPVGIAVMALLSKRLQYVPRQMAKPRDDETGRSEHAGGKGDAVVKNDGGRPRCLCGRAATAHAVRERPYRW